MVRGDDIAGDLLGHFALSDLDGESWSRERLVGSPAVLFCFATW